MVDRLRSLLAVQDVAALHGVFDRWVWAKRRPRRRQALMAQVRQAMRDEGRVQQRLADLPEKLSELLDHLLQEPRAPRGAADVPRGAFESLAEVRAGLAALQREGFAFVAASGEGEAPGPAAQYVVPAELVESIERLQRRQRQELGSVLTLRGHLEARRDREAATDRTDKVVKLYTMERALRRRVAKLPAKVRPVVDAVLDSHGGMASFDDLAATLGRDVACGVEPRELGHILESALVGTVTPLPLDRFGLQSYGSAVVIFREVAAVLLEERASTRSASASTGSASASTGSASASTGSASASTGSASVERWLDAGADLVSNVSRFLRDLQATRVQFTVDGELYKASARRIERSLLPLAGGVLHRDAQLRLIFNFCRAQRLIGRCGERALRLTDAGRRFEEQSLPAKVRSVLAFALDESGASGECFHQARVRRALLRLLATLEPGQCQELSLLPFLARNAYLARLERLGAEQYFAAREKRGLLPTLSVQQLSWELVGFVKRRLFALGLVELGMCGDRPIAMRLSRLGAELLGADALGADGAGEGDEAPSRSEVVVNPDYEVLLFPGADAAAVVHLFDRFAERLKTDHVVHFRLTREALQAALRDGVGLAEILDELSGRSRVPLPQNVVYSLRDWGDEAGVLRLDGGAIHGHRPEVVDRFVQVAQMQGYVGDRVSSTSVALRDEGSFEALRREAREHGFYLERGRHGD